ncbi:MAG TPA: hypothetical protein VF666_19085 [Pyrinomonadaceae bacterium]|jgi:hypothetical protein
MAENENSSAATPETTGVEADAGNTSETGSTSQAADAASVSSDSTTDAGGATATSGDASETGDGGIQGGGDETTAETPIAETSTEEITYHAVEKDGNVTAIWEMQGRKHLRTIDPRSRQGQEILRLYTAEHPDEAGAHAATENA